MKLNELKTIVKTAVKEAIQEEMKDILLEAIKTPKQVVSTPTVEAQPLPKEDKLKQHQDVVEYLNKGYKYDDIVKLTDKSLSTIQRVKKLVNS